MATSFKAVSNARTNDRDGNGITSQEVGDQRGLDVNVISGDITIDNAEINVELDAEDGDNVAIHNSSTGDEWKINPNGSGDVNVIDSVLPDGAATEATLELAAASLTNLDAWESSGLPAGNNNIGNVDVVSSALPSGAATEAKQDTGNASLSSIDSKITTTANGIRVDSVVTSSVLPSGASTLAEQQTQITRLTSIRDAVEIMDDWDESDRAKVNLIVGEAGITAGAGAVATNTPRITHASNDPVTTSVQLLDDTVYSDGDSSGKALLIAGAVAPAAGNAIHAIRVDSGGRPIVNVVTSAGQQVFTVAYSPTDGAAATGLGPQVTNFPILYEAAGNETNRQRSISAAFDTDGTGCAVAAVVGQLDDVATATVTENNFAPPRITASRALHTNLRNASGTEIATSGNPLRIDPTGTTAQPISASQTATTVSTDTEVSVTGSSTQLLAANSSRKKVFIQNHGTGYVRVRLAATALTTSPIRLVPEVGTYELKSEDGFVYRGVINAISETGTNLVGVIEET